MGKKRVDNNWGMQFAGVDGSSTAIKQHNVENDYDKMLLPGSDQNASRARQQGIGSELFNGISRAAVKVLPNVIGNAAAIADLEDYYNQDDEVGNYVTKTMQDLSGQIDNFFPVYEKNPGEALSFGDSAWWVKNMSSVLGSGLEFAITGAGVAGVVGKGLSLVGATGKAAQAINIGANALALNQAEALVAAQTVYKNAYEFNKKRGLGEDEAKQIAADAASYTININRLNLPLNLTSSALFVKTPIATRSLVTNLNKANTLKRFAGEGAQEFGEELINHIGEAEGGRRGEAKKYSVSNTIKDVFSAEGIEAGLLGALGGIAQTGFTEVVNEFNGHNKDWRERYKTQQDILKTYEDLRTSIPGQERLENIMQNVAVQSSLMNKIYEADLSNNTGESERLRGELLQYQALNAFKNGTTEQLVGLFDHIMQNPEGEAKHGKDYAIKAQEAKDNIVKWENMYNSYIGRYPEDRVEHVFNNVLEKENILKSLISNTKKIGELQGKIAQNEALGIPSTVEQEELAKLTEETEGLKEGATTNAKDYEYINSKDFNAEEYKRSKVGKITGEEPTPIKPETPVESPTGETPIETPTESKESPDDITEFNFEEGGEDDIVLEDDTIEGDNTPKDYSALKSKFFKASEGKYIYKYKIKNGKIEVGGAEYADGRPITDKNEFDAALALGEKHLENINSLTPEQVEKLGEDTRGGKIFSMENINKAKTTKKSTSSDKHGRTKGETAIDYINRLYDSGVLSEVDGKRFFFLTKHRVAVIVNIGGIQVPFYQSTSGASGKSTGSWYPIFGDRGAWLIKGSEKEIADNYGVKSLADAQEFLNKNISEADALIVEMPSEIKQNLEDLRKLPEDKIKADPKFSINKEASANRLATALGYDINEANKITDDRALFEYASKNVLAKLKGQKTPTTLNGVVNKMLSDLENFIKEIAELGDAEGLRERLDEIIKPRDKYLKELSSDAHRDKLFTLNAAWEKALAAIEAIKNRKLSDEPVINDAPPKLEDLFSEAHYKSHTAFRTTNPMYEEAEKNPDKYPEVIRWQKFVNTFKGDYTKYKLKVITKHDKDNYEEYQTASQKKHEADTGETGIVVLLVDREDKPVEFEGHPLVTVLLKNEVSSTVQQAFVSKRNMARHMNIPFSDTKRVDEAYDKMWEEQRALREELLTGAVPYLSINGMGKGVPKREKAFEHSIVGRAVSKLSDAQFKVGTTDVVNGEIVDTTYYGPQGFPIKSGYLYVIHDGEPVALKPRVVTPTEIDTLIDALSKLTQDDHVANKRIDAFVKQYIFTNSQFDEKGLPIGGRKTNSLYTRGNTIFFGVDGSIKVGEKTNYDELRRFLTTKYRQVQASKINVPSKVYNVNGEEIGDYREFLFTGDNPAFKTNLPKLGELARVNNYFTYEKAKAEVVIPTPTPSVTAPPVVILDDMDFGLGDMTSFDFEEADDVKDEVEIIPEDDVTLDDLFGNVPSGFADIFDNGNNKPSVFAVQSYIQGELSSMSDRFTPDELREFIKQNDTLTKEQILAAFIQHKKLC